MPLQIKIFEDSNFELCWKSVFEGGKDISGLRLPMTAEIFTLSETSFPAIKLYLISETSLDFTYTA